MLDHLRRLAAALDVRPAELTGLLVLLVSGTCVSLAIAVSAANRPSTATPVVVEGVAVTTTAADVTVHVAGAVRQPGVVILALGARVADAIAAAGGPRPDANLDGLNLAAHVEDGERVLVPAAGGGADAVVLGADPDPRVDLNAATARELEALPGIGPVLAQRIVSWREQHGPFREPGDLRAVPGIGERTFQSLAELVKV